MTPRETVRVIEAAAWRLEQAHRDRLALAWHIAALMRTKKLPALERLLKPPPKPLTGAELETRRREFEDMKQIMERHHQGRSHAG